MTAKSLIAKIGSLALLGGCRLHSADAFASPRQLTNGSHRRQRFPHNRQSSYPESVPSRAPEASPGSFRTTTTTTSLPLAGIEEAWSSYLTALEADPLLVKSVTAGVILGAADLTGQAIQQAQADTAGDGDVGSDGGGGGVDVARFVRFAFL